MKFITYNESPGGVYKSQVIDVCRFLENTFHIEVELIVFVSLRTYFKDRKLLKKLYSNCSVLPSFPGIENWRRNLLTLKLLMLFRKKDKAIARGVFATLLALDCKKFSAVCFDARTAYAAEWKEYLASESPAIAAVMNVLEKEALLRSNFRIAISTKLVSYWKEKYKYDKNEHVVIPCTIDGGSELKTSNQHSIIELRKQLDVNETDILLVFSGSIAGWQSLDELYRILINAFNSNTSLKLLQLIKKKEENELSAAFPGRVITEWVEPEMVSNYLKAADYGLLYREESITNSISSPVKFAEYLAAGLPVIISDNVGDYSSFVKENNCGLSFNHIDWATLKSPSAIEKERIKEIAIRHFTKSAYTIQYKQIVEMV